MYRGCLIIILAFITSICLAQSRQIDSLKNVLHNNNINNQERAQIYRLIAEGMRTVNVEEAKNYGREAIIHSKRGNYKKELAEAYIEMGYLYSATGEVEKSLSMADSGLQIGRKYNLKESSFFGHALMGGCKRKMARYEEALQHYLKATEIAENSKDLTLMGKAYNLLGVFYLTTDDIERATYYNTKSLNARLEVGDNREIYKAYTNLGIVYRELKQYDTALQYYFKANEYAVKANDSGSIAFTYNDIGAAYSFLGAYVKAEEFLKASIAIRERIGEMDELAYTYNYLGENYERRNDLQNGERYIKKALTTAFETQNNKQIYEAYESLSDFYARNKRFDSAYKYAMKYKYFKDSIMRMDQGKMIAELTTKFETAQKEKKIQEQQYQIAKRNYWIGGISILMIAGTLLAFSRHKRNRLKQQAALQTAVLHQQELATKAILEAEENERRRIATDLHDGVGQMMSAAKLNLSSLKSEINFTEPHQEEVFDNALALVDDSCKEVRNVSHNIMPNSLLKSGLASAIRAFINKIDSKVMKVNMYSEGLNERMDNNTENVLYRIVQECVNNVIKHANANTLDITLIKDNDGISITVEDNGQGFDIEQLSQGIGQKNIRSRAEYLKGTVEWNTAPGKGTVVMVYIPSLS